MFSFFTRNPIKKLNKQYEAKLEQAMHAQRNGDIRTYSMLTAEAEKINDEMIAIEQSQKAG
ncbi:DUF6435 family protein [Shewanella sp. ULN5]|jgi:hypothetical protein|uniref:DUF6435 family protein n=1 Tax=Shewanella sp. ULN5 TaxID=2994678 RepID=UPI00273EE92F|nr:DUF6435 family protein [Shewanella sp. ULN5]MDP5147527.1 DUF6435 family protein [Shewanella sp. ULN5]